MSVDTATVALLRQAAGKLRQGHCKKHMAVRVSGKPCAPSSEQAVAWCVVGALVAVLGDPKWLLDPPYVVPRLNLAYTMIRETLGLHAHGAISDWSDSSSGETCARGLERAAAALEAM